MAYLGLVPSEHSSGSRTQRGGITKTGNRHVRKAIISAAWKYATPPRCSKVLRDRQEGLPADIIEFA
ncbi:MAG: IS110 family transposase [Rhodothermaceae bacterium]|nr:IS110 family transposase [Rhodothermaceae bacterium]MYG69689.1 IS110 family transposase [Rhodothermaceae bacterium]MYJ19134.1 IS110 family transposase [Rhodothermaceae bacterium]